MAQILKDEQRSRIITAAKEEFLSQGYQKASMRLIAKNAKMTVGNLYRYFANKEELIWVITAPTLNKIDACIAEKTEDQISLYSDALSINLTQAAFETKIIALASDLVSILESDYEEMQILILYSDLNVKLILWFANLLNQLVSSWYPVNLDEQKYVLILCDMFAQAICSGFMKLFTNYHEYKQQIDISVVMEVYLQQFLLMLPKIAEFTLEENK